MATYAGPGTITLGGVIDIEVMSMTYDVNPSNKPVVTQAKGYAGHAKGPLMADLSFEFAVRSTGLYVDWMAVGKSQAEIDLLVRFGNRIDSLRGTITKIGLTSSAEGEVKGSAQFTGGLTSTTTV